MSQAMIDTDERPLLVPYCYSITSAGLDHLLTLAFFEDKWDELLKRCRDETLCCGDTEHDAKSGYDQSNICWNITFLSNILKPNQGPFKNLAARSPIKINKEAFQVNLQSRTPLHLCVFHPKCPLAVVQALVDLNPHAVVTLDCFDDSALHYACQFGFRRQKIDLRKLWASEGMLEDFRAAMKEEKERDEIVELLCRTIIRTDRQLMFGEFTLFDGVHPPREASCCYDNKSQSFLFTLRLNALAKERQVSQVSPLFLACKRNAPLRTIRALLDARSAAYSAPFTLPEREASTYQFTPQKIVRTFPGSWIAPVTGAEPWFSSCIEPRDGECSMIDYPDVWSPDQSIRNSLGALVYLLQSRGTLTQQLLGYESEASFSLGNAAEFRHCPIQRSDEALSAKKRMIKSLMQHAFTNFNSDIYLYFTSPSTWNALEERDLLNEIGWLPKGEDYRATLSEFLPTMEIAQKIGYLMQESSRDSPCKCNFSHCGFGKHHNPLGMEGKKFCNHQSSTHHNYNPMANYTTSIADLSINGWSPLHAAASLIHSSNFLLEILLGIFPQYALARDDMGFTPLHHALFVYKLSTIYTSCNYLSNKASLKRMKSCATTINTILSHAPESATVRCGNGMTTTHLAIHCGLNWYDGLSDIVLKAGAADVLPAHSKDDNLQAFMLAACCDLSLDSIYLLLRTHPIF